MKELVKQLLPPLLTELLKRAKYLRPHYFGLDNLDQKLERYLDFDGGYFVELGANDGLHQSNTLYYERYRGWRGVLVEPIPHNYLLCRAHRSRDTHIFCNACTSFDYKEKFVELVYSNLMSASIGLESDVLDPFAHARRGKILLGPTEANFVFGSPARPLNSILTEVNAPQLIDFLSLDVEGAEIDVLKGIDHTGLDSCASKIEVETSSFLS